MKAFDWDSQKASTNQIKHGISFQEASTIFENITTQFYDDTEHSANEYREIAIGYSASGQLLTVVFTERNNAVRIVSARKSTKQERVKYERE